jgi:hypothetical protein
VRENALPESSRSLENKSRFHGEEMRLGVGEEAAKQQRTISSLSRLATIYNRIYFFHL